MEDHTVLSSVAELVGNNYAYNPLIEAACLQAARFAGRGGRMELWSILPDQSAECDGEWPADGREGFEGGAVEQHPGGARDVARGGIPR
jgi:hypothetical protein